MPLIPADDHHVADPVVLRTQGALPHRGVRVFDRPF